MKIGIFTKSSDTTFSGIITTLSVNQAIEIVAVEGERAAKAPDYRVYLADTQTEIGAGWLKTSRQGNKCLAIKIDDPALPAPVNATLFPNGHTGYDLLWQRTRAGYHSEKL